ncbi:MAG TPA: hypothetical protein VIM55_07370 [Mucilaginibacter sp.]
MKSQHIAPASIAPDTPVAIDENPSVIDQLLQILKETKAAISANWRHENDIAELFVAFGG